MKKLVLAIFAMLSSNAALAWEGDQTYNCKETGETIVVKQKAINVFTLDVADPDEFTTRKYTFSPSQNDPQEAFLTSAVNPQKFDGARARYFGKGKAIVFASARGITTSCALSAK